MARPGAKLAKWMQSRRTRLAKELVPYVGPDPHDAGKCGFDVAKFHCAKYGGEVREKRPNDLSTAGTRFDCYDEKDRSASEGSDDGLGKTVRAVGQLWTAGCVGCHKKLFLTSAGPSISAMTGQS